MDRKEPKNELYLYDTHVENFFIGDYLPSAPGDAVKVYLYALMYADIKRPLRREEIAKALNLSTETVDDVWMYWETRSVVRRIFPDPSDRSRYEIEFRRLKETVFRLNAPSRPADPSAAEAPDPAVTAAPEDVPDPLTDGAVRDMFRTIEEVTGEPVSDPKSIVDWIGRYGATPEMIAEAFRYAAVSRKKTRPSYVEAIVREWAERDLKTPEAIREHLEANDARHTLYRRVLRALGFYRNATEEEERMMDAWFDDWGFGIDKVLEACKKTAGIGNPNMKYINTVLRGWFRDEHGKDPASKEGALSDPADPSAVTAAFVRKRTAEYARLREEEEADAEKRRGAAFAKAPRLAEIEKERHALAMNLSRMALGATGFGAASAMKRRLESLEKEYRSILESIGLTPYDLEIHYACAKCRDTGYLEDGSRCECFTGGTPAR